MNQPHDQSPRDASEPPFVRPGAPAPAEEQPDVPEPLAPFFGGLHEIEIPADDVAPPAGTGAGDPSGGRGEEAGEAAGDDVPWLVREDRDPVGPSASAPTAFDAPSYLGGVPEVDIDSSGDIVSFDDLGAEAVPARGGPGSAAGSPLAAAASSAEDQGGWHSAFPSEEARTADAARELHVEQAGGFREAGSHLAEEVAVRLEKIARSLRSTTPAEMLAGSGDPLEILIIGYVLGASRGNAEHSGDQASTL